MIHTLLRQIFSGFEVDGVSIPVNFLFYQGHGEPYITYMQQDADNSLSGDDDLLGYVEYYDFDIYSRGNYLPIVERVIEIMESNGFVFQPSRSSADMYEVNTGYYHKTLNFAILKSLLAERASI